MRFDILTLFPEVITPYVASSILGRAVQADHLSIAAHNIRDYAPDKHHTTDDTPYGGGAGMVMKVEPIDLALQAIRPAQPTGNSRTVVLSAAGRPFTQAVAQEYAALANLTLICGRYEGIDQRVIDHLADEELSIGPYVLAGGELAAMVVLEAVARLIPGVLGNPDSLLEESHSLTPHTLTSYSPNETMREYPQYTKPEVYRGWTVPAVLLSGDHAAIKTWRTEQTARRTASSG